MGAIVWGAVALAMYAILRALGTVVGPFDPGQEFASVIGALVKTARASIAGDLQGLWALMPALPNQEGLVVLVATIVRLVEILALAITAAAILRTITVICQGIKYSRP